MFLILKSGILINKKGRIMRASVYRRLQEQRIIELSKLAVSVGLLVILSLIFIISFGCALAKFN
jgi:hypothetical protein